MKLKPCPFCGQTPDRDDPDCVYPVTRPDAIGGCIYRAGCIESAGGCGAEVLGDSAEDAIVRWNERTESEIDRCRTCRYWMRFTDALDVEIHGIYAGKCSCDKFVYKGSDEEMPQDGLAYWDYEGCSAGFETGEDFGCVHYQRRES